LVYLPKIVGVFGGFTAVFDLENAGAY